MVNLVSGREFKCQPVQDMTKTEVIDLSMVELLMKWKNDVMNPPKKIEETPPVLGIVEKVAIVDLKEHENNLRFFETITLKRGLNLKVFIEPEEAERWLKQS